LGEDELPKSRACQQPKGRLRLAHKPDWFQSQTECNFTPEEIAARAWDALAEKCSENTRCVCAVDEDWTEESCLSMDTVSATTIAHAKHSGKDELFVRQKQTYPNMQDDCVQKEKGPLEYQNSDTSPTTTKGCCVRTEEKSRMKKTSCVKLRLTQSCPRKRVHWHQCAEWEQLFHCSGNGGRSQSGQLFKRKSSIPGFCVGDETNVARLTHTYGAKVLANEDYYSTFKLQCTLQECTPPSGTASYKGCTCEVGCGSIPGT